MSQGNEVAFHWRGPFSNGEVHALHAEAFKTRLYDESEWNWVDLCARHSLGWVVAREGDGLLGFVNVVWDGLVHAYLEDMMVAAAARHRRIGVGLVHAARDAARASGCEYLHVGFEEEHRPFYIDACGFAPFGGGLMDLV
jgi:GNAT superfamily N-acetyltransferase